MDLSYQQSVMSTEPCIFNRGTLELTFQALRLPSPSLALKVRNAAMLLEQSSPSDLSFHPAALNLSVEEISSIIQALSRVSERLCVDNQKDRGELLMVRSLMLDWLVLRRALSLS